MPDGMSNGDLSKQKAILDRLRDELEQAKALYEGAKKAYEKARKEYDDSSPAPAEALKRVTQMHEFTQELYTLAVQRFNSYLLRGDDRKPIITTASRRLHRVG